MVELLERWPAAVGDAIAQKAWPARIGRDGTVHVNTADAVWAFELGQRATEIAERLGVPKLRFAPGPLPEPDAEAAPRPVEPTAEDEERARAMTVRIRDEDLRKSAQRAVALGLARAARDRRV
jgi:predicted nucleic acid-binding Zn ribbon protein